RGPTSFTIQFSETDGSTCEGRFILGRRHHVNSKFSPERHRLRAAGDVGYSSFSRRQEKREAPLLERIGNCRILAEIASGGMAVVYKAGQELLNRTVAIKALKSSVAADSHFAIRFEREALSLAQLQHENIIHIYDFHKERGAYFIVMEFVEGIDLYDLMER